MKNLSVFFAAILIIIPILLIFFLIKKSSNSNKKKQYRTLSIVLLVIGILLSLAVIGNEDETTNELNSADGFEIESFQVKLNVNKNNIIDVTEIITLDFYESGHHGIYRFIPKWLEYTGNDNNTISRKSNIKDLKVIDENYSLDTIKGKDRIKIGSPDSTLPIGLKTYTITYKYDMGKDPYDGFDEFIFHAFGDYWGTTINNASIEVTMPEEIRKKSIRFYEDKYRNEEITNYINYSINGNTLYADLSSLSYLNNAVTIDILLPEDYFVGANNIYGYTSLILCSLVIVFAIIVFIMWIKYGKNYSKRAQTVEFYPPDNYDSAEIGYIYKKESGRKLAVSIIVELASKGYIRIDESEDKSTRTITNLCTTINANSAIKRKILISKIKEPTKKSDIEVMNTLFENGSNTATITADFDKFYSDAKSLISNEYIKIDSDTINEYTEELLDNITNNLKEDVFKNNPMSKNEQLVFERLFRDSDTNILNEDTGFYKVFNDIDKNLESELSSKIDDNNSYKYMLISSIMFFTQIIYVILSYALIKDLNPQYSSIYGFDVILIIITFILVLSMRRKTQYGEYIYSRVKGFRNYLEIAEKDQINDFVNKNPNYFFNILPYAYVLGVSKKWISKFENIPIPVNMGNFDYTNINSFNDLSNSIYYPSSGSSSCGGGCSSCGGGCSSCGGGSSW